MDRILWGVVSAAEERLGLLGEPIEIPFPLGPVHVAHHFPCFSLILLGLSQTENKSKIGGGKESPYKGGNPRFYFLWSPYMDLPIEKLKRALMDERPSAVLVSAGAWFARGRSKPDLEGFKHCMEVTLENLTHLQKEVSPNKEMVGVYDIKMETPVLV